MRHIKYIYTVLLFLVSSISTFGQAATVSFIKTVPKKSWNDTIDSVITYPVFIFKNKGLADNINKTVRAEFYKLYKKNKSVPIKAVLKSLA